MLGSQSEISLPLINDDAVVVGHLRIAPATSPRGKEAIVVIPPAEARMWRENETQLLEGVSYDYELSTPLVGARMREGLLRRGVLNSPGIERGRLDPGSHTGSLTLVLESNAGARLATCTVEVRSSKLFYREQYRRMLDDIAEKAIELLVDLKSPSGTWFAPEERNSADSIAQKFFFLKHLIGGVDLKGAMQQIARSPHESTGGAIQEQSIRAGLRGANNVARQLLSSAKRTAVPLPHRLSDKVASLPTFVTKIKPLPTHDTAENRFIKYVLKSFRLALEEIEMALSSVNGADYRYIIADCKDLRSELNTLSDLSIFRGIDDSIHSFPLSSPVLQRRSGYREVLRAWYQFSLASRLSWDGADDVFMAGKKDVATLYEYWLFFKILEVVRRKFEVNVSELHTLFARSRSSQSLRLKSGRSLSLFGQSKAGAHNLRIRLSYNRTFARAAHPPGDEEKSFPNPGSWTKSMRPDYTISLWPNGMSENEAEFAEKIAHLHFDAKYRIETLGALFGDDVDEEQQSYADVKRTDLLKMHSYRDAIRRSQSAFVLYPGTENKRWKLYTEILPGLGAISIVPGKETGLEVLANFLENAALAVAENGPEISGR